MKKFLLSISLVSIVATSSYAGSAGGDIFRSSFLIDKLEHQYSDEKATVWDISGYAGYDQNKIYIYSEGEKPKTGKASSENQLLYSRAIAPYWDFQTGLEYDKTPTHDKTWAVLGINGLAPYFFETKASLLVNSDGNVGIKANAEYEALFTQKLILTPSVEFSAYSKNDETMEIGSGLSNINVGARLRYEITREFAPYIGVEWNRNLGKTNDYAPLNDTYIVAGVRFWF